MVEPFEDAHPPAGAGEIRRGDEPVVPAADDDGVECRRPGGFGVECRRPGGSGVVCRAQFR
ncbi:hypothetical protein A5757_05950 [Mycobacterium sp. 852013-51886_SCH5428379]|nr:hypothetical protein A5757_05950 [Mycobacterium sp. 852013-51886_SCH5428379]